MLKPQSNSRSPLTLLLLIAFLVISTLVMISNYFFRPGLEQDLRNKIISKLQTHNISDPMVEVEGRDVILRGIALNTQSVKKLEAEIESISGVHHIESEFIFEK